MNEAFTQTSRQVGGNAESACLTAPVFCHPPPKYALGLSACWLQGWQGVKAWARRLWIPPRIQAFEFCDQAWLQGCWREAYLDGLNFLFQAGRIYRNMHVPFARWAAASGHDQVLDLASGGGGPIETMLATAGANQAPMPHVMLSDLFPHRDAFQRLQTAFPAQVDFMRDPVDATDTSRCPGALLSICTGFHHFHPSQARKVLDNAAKHSDGLFIMEVFERNLASTFLSLFNLLPLMAAPFFAKRITFKKVAISTLLPIIPLLIMFDGVVSALRTYRREELLAMLPEGMQQEWHWQSGRERYLGFFHSTYLFGCRKSGGT